MATATEIITRSLTRLGIRAAETSLEPAELQDGLDLLNDMLSNWEEAGYNLGFSPVAGLTDEVRIPRGANAAVIDALAIIMAPEYSRPVSAALAASAKLSFENMLSANVFMGDVDMPSTLPRGSGNQCDDDTWFDTTFFPQKDKRNF
ncbi:hypothetical protein KAR91_09920 [Candidatus Pacearchaeota archaeon]|nr:hypothetical protein [Candidatus Pacearchaeota archaeon]